MAAVVLDASAMLAMIKGEKGADKVTAALPEAVLSTVNAAEVLSKLDEWKADPRDVARYRKAMHRMVRPFDMNLAMRTGRLRLVTKPFGLSLGDRACLALALREKLPVMTADRHWTTLGIGVTIDCIR